MTTATSAPAPRTSSLRAVAQADRDTATRLGDVVGRLVRMLRRSYVGTLGPASASTLVSVVRSGPVRLGELADREGVTPAALSRVVAGLEREDLLQRAADPEDRRSVFVMATDAGRASAEALRAARAAALVERMTHLTVAERDLLVAGLEVLEKLVAEPSA